MAAEWRTVFLEPKTLMSTYTHSHIETFMNSFMKYNLDVEKYLNSLKTIKNTIIRDVKDRIDIIYKIEEEYLKFYNADRRDGTKLSRESFLLELDETFKNPVVEMWGGLKASIVKNTKIKKDKDGNYSEEMLALYKAQLEGIGKKINKYVKEYKRLIGGAFEKSGQNKDYSQYVNSIKQLEEVGIKLEKIENDDKKGKNFQKLFKEAVKSTIDLGWTIEPITARLIYQKIKTSIVGKEYMSGGTVIDLEIMINKQLSGLGINVKSQLEKYKISRSNFKSKEYKELGVWKKEIDYLRRNLGALKLYSINYSQGNNYNKEFLKVYNKFYDLEKQIAFYSNLISALDAVVENKKTSILISFQGGFLWTSDVLELIMKDIKRPFKDRKIISYRTQPWKENSDKMKLKSLWYQKKKILRDQKIKEKNIYEQLSGTKVQIKHNTMVHMITYTINLANAKSGG